MDVEDQTRLLIRVNDFLQRAIGALSCIPLEDDCTSPEAGAIRTNILSLSTLLDLRTRDTVPCPAPPPVTGVHLFAAISCCDDLQIAREHLASLQESTRTYYTTLATHLNALLTKEEGEADHMSSQMLIAALFPHATRDEQQRRSQKLQAVREKNRSILMGKNHDYQQGYTIGEYLYQQGEGEFDIKDLHAQANELLEELPYGELPVNDTDAFTEGMVNGYTLSSDVEDKRRK